MKTSFSWNNYFKPTPKNLEYFASSLRRLVTLLTTGSLVGNATHVTDFAWWVPVAIALTGGVLDELKNFFAHVAADGEHEVVSVTFPSELSDQVEVTQETKEPT